MTRSTLYLRWRLAITAVIWITPHLALDAQDLISLEIVTDRIQNRQTAVRSAKFAWSQRTFERKGARSELNEIGQTDETSTEERPRQRNTVPVDDAEYTHEFFLSFDGAKTNFSSEQRMYTDVNQWQDLKTRRTFNGEQQMSLRQPWGDRKYVSGRIYKEGEPNRDVGLLVLEPLLQCYRLPLPAPDSPQWQQIKLDNREIEIRGTRTVTLSVNTARLQRIFSLDPAREFLPIRSTVQSGDLIQRQTDFEYQADDQVGWILSGWEITKFTRDGGVSHRISATVGDYTINPEFNAAEFQIEFPPGTLIDDLQENSAFIQLPNSTRRRITASEFGKPYEELVASDLAGRTRKAFIVANIILLGVALAYFLFGTRRKKRSI